MYKAREYYDGGGGGGGDGTGDGDGSGADNPFVISWVDLDATAVVNGANVNAIRVAFNKNVGYLVDDVSGTGNETDGRFIVYDAAGNEFTTGIQVYNTNVSGSEGYATRQYAHIYRTDGEIFDSSGTYTVFINPEVRNRASNPDNLQTIDEWNPADYAKYGFDTEKEYTDAWGTGYFAGYNTTGAVSGAGYFDVGYVNLGSELGNATAYEFAGVLMSKLHAEKLARR